MFDITKPWVMFLCALSGPLVAYVTYQVVARAGLDEPKVPLVLGPGIYVALLPGIVHSRTPTGGFLGITSGAFAFQGAQISFASPAIGVIVTLAIAFGSGLVTMFALEKTIGLRVSEEAEMAGLDAHYWGGGVGADLDTVDHRGAQTQSGNGTAGLEPPIVAERQSGNGLAPRGPPPQRRPPPIRKDRSLS